MMADGYQFPEGALVHNRGLIPGARITEITGTPHLQDGEWTLTPHVRVFEVLSVEPREYQCRYLGETDT